MSSCSLWVFDHQILNEDHDRDVHEIRKVLACKTCRSGCFSRFLNIHLGIHAPCSGGTGGTESNGPVTTPGVGGVEAKDLFFCNFFDDQVRNIFSLINVKKEKQKLLLCFHLYFIPNYLKQDNNFLKVQEFMLDFEKKQHTACKTVFPAVKPIDCLFHLTQSFYQNTKKICL